MICTFAICDINIIHDDKTVPPFSNKKLLPAHSPKYSRIISLGKRVTYAYLPRCFVVVFLIHKM